MFLNFLSFMRQFNRSSNCSLRSGSKFDDIKEYLALSLGGLILLLNIFIALYIELSHCSIPPVITPVSLC